MPGRRPLTWQGTDTPGPRPHLRSASLANLREEGLDSPLQKAGQPPGPIRHSCSDPRPPLHGPSPLSNTSCPPSSPGQKICHPPQILRRNSSGSHLPPPSYVFPVQRFSVPVLPLVPLSVFFRFISSPAPFSSSLYEIYLFFKKSLFIWLPWALVVACRIFSCNMWDLVP